MMNEARQLKITGRRSTGAAGSGGLTPSRQCAFKRPFAVESRSVSAR